VRRCAGCTTRGAGITDDRLEFRVEADDLFDREAVSAALRHDEF
jgi:hypothetical protein